MGESFSMVTGRKPGVIVSGGTCPPIVNLVVEPCWQQEVPDDDGWYVVGWAPDSGPPAYACIKVVGNPISSPYADGVRWWPVPLDLPPLPPLPEED